MKYLLALVALVAVNAQAGNWEHTQQVGKEVAAIVGMEATFVPVNSLHDALAQAIPLPGKCVVKVDNTVFQSDDDNKIAYILAHEMGHCNYTYTKQATDLTGREYTWYTEYYADGFATMLVNTKFDPIAGAQAALANKPDSDDHPGADRRLEAMQTGTYTYY